MMSLKPIFLLKYLRLKRNKIPSGIKKLFYLSWEDAFWDLLAKKQVKKGAVVLVPQYYCGDVENNIINHGYTIKHYPADIYLQTSETELINKLKEYRPRVVIIFHAFGITNNLLLKPSWLSYLSPQAILIEDCVHRIIDPNKIHFLTKNHFFLDSLRKTIPLQGGALYGSAQSLDFDLPPFWQSLGYSLRVHFLWLLMNIFWFLAQTTSGTKLSSMFAIIAKIVMKKGYNLIGDSLLPSSGFSVFNFLQQLVDIKKIEKIKEQQVKYYQQQLKLKDSNQYITVPFSKNDWKKLNSYPLVLPLTTANQTLQKIKDKGLMLDFELNDSLWSKKNKIISLPLGPYLSQKNLKDVVKCVIS